MRVAMSWKCSWHTWTLRRGNPRWVVAEQLFRPRCSSQTVVESGPLRVDFVNMQSVFAEYAALGKAYDSGGQSSSNLAQSGDFATFTVNRGE